jgi:hypothetical protein
MFVRLTRSKRLTAGWMAAAVYLLCVLAPGAALALGRGPVPCFVDELIPVTLVSEQHDPAAAHMHADGSLHDHGGVHAHHHADAGAAPIGHNHDGKTLPGPCCAMLCVTALPANLPALAKPSQPVSTCVIETSRSVPGEPPPLHYRPPIT